MTIFSCDNMILDITRRYSSWPCPDSVGNSIDSDLEIAMELRCLLISLFFRNLTLIPFRTIWRRKIFHK